MSHEHVTYVTSHLVFFTYVQIKKRKEKLKIKLKKHKRNRIKPSPSFATLTMIAMETEEGHDKIVEEVLRRLEENDLFVKPEKCM